MKFSRTTLDNGVRVIAAPMPGSPTVTVMVSVATGAFHEAPEEAGISHFLEHMCFKGTTKRPSARAITTELDSIGAAYNASTSYESTGFYAKAAVRHFDAIADIVSDIALNSTLPEGEIEKEKKVIMGEIDMYADDPQEKAHDTLRERMYRGQPASRDVLGTKETVGGVTRDALLAYRKRQYVAKNLVITIAGGVDEARMLGWAKAAFGGMPAEAGAPAHSTLDLDQAEPTFAFVDKDTDQTHLALGWRALPRTSADRYVAAIARSVLRGGMSSRLFIRLRDDMGSGYYVGCYHAAYPTFGRFVVTTGTTPGRVAEITGAILEEADRLKTELVPETELSKVKEFIRSHTLMSLEASDDIADYLADQELDGDPIRTPEEFDAIFASVTAEDVRRVARSIFDHRKLTLVAVGKGVNRPQVEAVVSKALGA